VNLLQNIFMDFSKERRATAIATATAAILAIFKLIIGIMSGSVALLASAVDSVLDTAISVFNFFAIKKAEEAPNDEFQYGKGKVQAIAGVIEGVVITLSGVYIIVEGIKKLLNDSVTTHLGSSIWVMVVSVVVTYFLVKYLERVAKETDNIVIKSDATHYKADLLSNGVVLLSLFIVWLSGWEIVDAIFGIAIGAYIIYSAYEIIHESILILLDRALDGKIVSKIGEIIASEAEVKGYHYLKTRTDGTHNFVDFHMVLPPNMTILEAHKIAENIIEKIVALDKTKGWLINPHFDPHDDEEQNILYFNGKNENE